jgi:rhodanese-related sulfurtransferase
MCIAMELKNLKGIKELAKLSIVVLCASGNRKGIAGFKSE